MQSYIQILSGGILIVILSLIWLGVFNKILWETERERMIFKIGYASVNTIIVLGLFILINTNPISPFFSGFFNQLIISLIFETPLDSIKELFYLLI